MYSNTEDSSWSGKIDPNDLIRAYNKKHGIRDIEETPAVSVDNRDRMTTREIAEHMELSERRVQRILESGLARFVKHFYMFGEIKKQMLAGVPEDQIDLEAIEKKYYIDGRKKIESMIYSNIEGDYQPDQRGSVWQGLRFLLGR